MAPTKEPEKTRAFQKSLLRSRTYAEGIDAFVWGTNDFGDDRVAKAIQKARRGITQVLKGLAEADSLINENRPKGSPEQSQKTLDDGDESD